MQSFRFPEVLLWRFLEPGLVWSNLRQIGRLNKKPKVERGMDSKKEDWRKRERRERVASSPK